MTDLKSFHIVSGISFVAHLSSPAIFRRLLLLDTEKHLCSPCQWRRDIPSFILIVQLNLWFTSYFTTLFIIFGMQNLYPHSLFVARVKPELKLRCFLLAKSSPAISRIVAKFFFYCNQLSVHQLSVRKLAPLIIVQGYRKFQAFLTIVGN